MNFKAFLFDLDGTLVDSEPLKARAIVQAVRHFGGSASTELYKEVMGKPWEVVTSHFFKSAGIDVSLDDFDPVFRSNYEELLDKELFLRPHLVVFLEWAKSRDIKLALVSSASKWMADKILNKLELSQYFDLVITREDVQKHKPDPEAFLMAMKDLNVSSDTTLIFEDSEAGIEAARSAGSAFAFVRHAFNERHAASGSFVVIESFFEFSKIFLHAAKD